MKNRKGMSLYLEWFLLVFIAGMVSLLFFVASRFVIEEQIDRYWENRNVVRKYNDKYISEIQEYITEQNISLKDVQRLDEWITDNKVIYIEIKKDDKWIYFSDPSMEEEAEEYDSSPFPSNDYYDIEFEDGTAQAFIMGMHSYDAYMIALVIDIIISFALFFVLTMLGIRRKISYINRLSQDIEILEGGNLEHEVLVQGNDELTDLARGLNAMKTSFRNQIEEVEYLTKKNQEMVTEISHDLRTPLTSVLLYAEILKSDRCRDEGSRGKYLDKIMKKIQHMKELSDKLLAYSVRAVEEKYVPAEYVSIRSALYDELSDMCQYLEEQRLKVKADLQWNKGQIYVYEKYLIRILDNISSNIIKYADREAAILIWSEYYTDEMYIIFENACIKGSADAEGYHIGIRNVKMMIEEMKGKCDITQDEERFRICLRFRYKADA